MTHFLYWVTHFTHDLHFCKSEEQFFFSSKDWKHLTESLLFWKYKIYYLS